MNKDFLYEMLKTPSVSGYEEALQRKVIHYMEDVCDEIRTDATGNVVSILNPDAKMKVLLCGHIDEIGFVITNIHSDGMIKVAKAGGVRAVLYLGTHVQIMNEKGIVNGVVVTNASLCKNPNVTDQDLIIDIGAASREEALKYVSVGDSVCAATDVKELVHDRVAARAMDDRIGAFIVLEALRKAKELGCKCGVYSATTVGEETSMRGAYFASQMVKPDCAVIVDVTYASDYPGVDGDATGEILLDCGAVLCHSSLNNKKMNHKLVECANKLGYEVQWEVAPGRAGTDGDRVHFTNDGVPIALVSIPLRYMHSSIETLSMKDVKEIIDLLAQFLCEMNENFSFCNI